MILFIIMFIPSRHWFLLCLITSVIAISPAELNALQDFKTSTNSAVWDPSNTWNFSGPGPCASTWVGLQCTSGKLTRFALYSKGIQGTIPSTFGSLIDLQIMLFFYPFFWLFNLFLIFFSYLDIWILIN